jgi:hypothetical protein
MTASETYDYVEIAKYYAENHSRIVIAVAIVEVNMRRHDRLKAPQNKDPVRL